MTVAAIIDNRITPLFIAAMRVLIEQGGCISAAFLSRGATSEMGQKAKYSLGADVFRFGPESGLKTDIAGGPVRARSGRLLRANSVGLFRTIPCDSTAGPEV